MRNVFRFSGFFALCIFCGALAHSQTQLQVILPGETATPGVSPGKTGTPTAQTAGTPFTVTVNAVDALWNVVPSTDIVQISSSDVNADLPPDPVLSAGSQTFSMTLNTAGSATVTASDVTTPAVTPNTSASVAVNAGALVKLQLLMPGETAAPGTTTGKTGAPTARTAGTQFTVTVNGVDANWNVVNAATDVVHIASSDVNATLPANNTLSSGTRTFNVTLNTAGSATVTASDVTTPAVTPNTTPSVSVSAGTLTKLQILMPGEVASPGSGTGKTGAPTAQTAGTPFTVSVNGVDANWNVVSSSDIVHIVSSDVNATLPANAALVGGTKTFSVTLNTAGSSTVTASDVSNGAIASNVSPSTTVSHGTFSKLQILVPGEVASPGSVSGRTGSPNAQGAGTPFTVTVNGVDANWNLVNTATDAIHIASSDVNATLPANNNLASGTRTFSVTLNTVGSATVTASDVTNGTITANTSPSVSVSAGTLTKLQILMPGEVAAPGTTTGKTGAPTARTAGSPFNVTVNGVDANWNVVSSTDVVQITSSDVNATLPANAALAAGTQTFSVTLKTVGNATVGASDVTNNGITSSTSPSVSVGAGTLTKLQILMPGEVAAPGTPTGKTGVPTARAAGSPFNVTVNAVDANWNVVSSTDVVQITSSDVNATLPANAALASGTRTFSVTLNTVGSATVGASDVTNGTITGNVSPSVTVNAGGLVKLQLLMPGEVAAPGTPTGKTGAPTAQTAGTAFTVTVNGVDANWNVVNSATDVIRIASSDVNATPPANAALVAGTRTFNVTFATAGSATVTASDVTNGTITSNVSPTTTVNHGVFAKLQLLMPGEVASPGSGTGKTGAPAAQGAGSPFNVTVNGVDANWNVVNTATDVVQITASDVNATLPANAALASGTRTFSVTLNTVGSATVGASDVTNGTITGNVSPSVTVNAGGLVKLQLLMPGEVAAPGTPTGKTGAPTAQTAGTPFTVTVNGVDANWNVVNTATDIVHIASSDVNATLPANAALAAGTRTFSVTARTAGSATVGASDVTNGAITSNVSPSTTVNHGAFVKLQLLMPGEVASPGSVTGKTGSPAAQGAGSPFNVTVNAVDASWNLDNAATDIVHIASSDVNATLPANAALASGTQTFSATLNTVGSATVTASDVTNGVIASNVSPSVTVSAGSMVKLQLLMPGEVAAPGTPTGKTGAPTVQTAGTPFTVTVNGVDANWNVVGTATDVIHIATSDVNATLPANAALAAGTRTFSVTFATAGSATVTASDVTNGTIASNTSPFATVNHGAFAKLQLLMPGEAAAPGTLTGKTGAPAVQTAGSLFQVTVNGVDANWNLVNTAADIVHIASSDANATLPANTALVAGTQTFTVTLRAAGNQTVTASDVSNGTITSNTSPSTSVVHGAFAKLQLLMPGEVASPGSGTGKTGVPTARTAGIAFTVTVNGVDANWNLVNTAADVVHIVTTDGNGVPPPDAALSAGTQTLILTLNTVGNATVTASDVTNGVITPNTSPSVTVNAGAIVKLQLLLPGEVAAPGTPTGKTGTPAAQTAGTPFSVTVNGVDANWNVVGTATDVVHIASSDVNATLPANAALAAGTRTFSVTLKTAGSQTVTGSDVTAPGVASSVSPAVAVVAGSASRLAFVQQPTNVVAGAQISPQVTVQLQDSLGNSLTTGGVTVTLTMTGTGTLAGNTSQQTIAGLGVATFGNLTVNLVGSKTLTASSTGLTPATSTAFTVSHDVASRLVFATQPTGGTAGLPLSQQPVVILQDQWGNPATGTSQSVTLSVQANPGGDTLRGTVTQAVNVSAQAIFTGISLNKAGIGYTLTATGNTVQTTPGVVVSTPFNVTTAAPSKVRVENQADGNGVVLNSQNVSSGTSITVYSICRDAYDNFISDTVATWSLSNRTGGVLPTDLAASVDRRSATFTGGVVGTAQINATVTGLSSVASGTLTVIVAGAPTRIRVETAANGTGVVLPDTTITSGNSVTVYAIARDNASNFIRNVIASWSVQSVTGGIVGGDLVPANGGRSAVLTGHLKGTAQVRADSGALSATLSGTIHVVAGSPASVTATAGSGQSTQIRTAFGTNLQATVRDAAGNPVGVVPVQFGAPGSGASGTFTGGSSPVVQTDTSGVATAPVFTANGVAGTYRDSARVTGIAVPAYFTLTNMSGAAANIAATGGTPDSAQVLTTYLRRMVATVRDSLGNPVRNVTVTFTPPVAGATGTFAGGNTAVTDTNGVATANPFTANDTAGSYTVSAAVSGVAVPAAFSLKNLPGAVAGVTATGGTPQSAQIRTQFAVRLSATVKDGIGNPVSGVLVTFNAPTSGPSGTFLRGAVDTARTGINGVATASAFTANTIAGSYSVTATVSTGGSPATFALTNNPGPLVRFTVEAQHGGTIGAQIVGTPFVILITARDSSNNAVTGFTGSANVTATGPLSDGGGTAGPFENGVFTPAIGFSLAGTFTITATRTGGTETGTSNSFAVTNPVPTATSIVPPGGRRGETLDVVITGTGFLAGVTNADFGNSIFPLSTVINGPTQLTKRIRIDSSAVEGTRNVVVFNAPPGGGTATGTLVFTVGNNPVPTITGISLAGGTRLQTSNLVIKGTNFISGVTLVNMGPGITINGTTVDSATQITANFTITAAAPTGAHTVTVTNTPPGGGTAALVNAFTVSNPSPQLTTIDPSGGNRLQRLALTVDGIFLIGGVTTVSFADTGITVDSTVALSSVSLTVYISIGATAALGPHDVRVTNPAPGGGSATLPGAFSISNPVPVLTSILPAGGVRFQTFNVVFRGSNFISGVSSVQFDAGIKLNSTSVDSSTRITANITIGAAVAAGPTNALVHNSVPGGGNSSGLVFTVANAVYPATYTVKDTVAFPTHSLAADYSAADYRIVGIPGASGAQVSTLVPGTGGTDWQMIWDNGASSNYFITYDGGANFVFSAGRAFWLLKKGPWILSATVPTAPLDTNGAVPIPLHANWNLITNPFLVSIPWAQVKAANVGFSDGLWIWTGGTTFIAATSFDPYVGYYCFNTPNLTSLKIPYSQSLSRTVVPPAPGTWNVGIALQAEGFTDRSLMFGVVHGAGSGLNSFDMRKPRTPGKIPSVYFNRPEWDPVFSTFATDYRGDIQDAGQWQFDVSSTARGNPELSFTGIGDVPPQFDVFLIDEGNARSVNLRTQALYRFAQTTDRAKFSVVVGSPAAVRTIVDAVVPREFAIGYNFPNPFNPSSTIPVDIPRNAYVTLVVYNTLGEEVKKLHDGVLEPGRYWFVWDGRGGGGNQVATGVYFARLSVSTGEHYTRKMLMLK